MVILPSLVGREPNNSKPWRHASTAFSVLRFLKVDPMGAGPTMAEPRLSMNPIDQEDDLPRTFRREKEARDRQARESEARTQRQAAPSASQAAAQSRGASAAYQSSSADLHAAPDFADRLMAEPGKVTVGAFDVPFMHMVRFFLKAVFAAIPALILLFVFLWAIGQAAQKYMPWLVKLRVLVTWQ
jgi:hypothetical protein